MRSKTPIGRNPEGTIERAFDYALEKGGFESIYLSKSGACGLRKIIR